MHSWWTDEPELHFLSEAPKACIKRRKRESKACLCKQRNHQSKSKKHKHNFLFFHQPSCSATLKHLDSALDSGARTGAAGGWYPGPGLRPAVPTVLAPKAVYGPQAPVARAQEPVCAMAWPKTAAVRRARRASLYFPRDRRPTRRTYVSFPRDRQGPSQGPSTFSRGPPGTVVLWVSKF